MDTYSLQPFLDALAENWFRDDPLLALLLHHHAGPGGFSVMALEDWGREVAGPLRKLAERSAQADGLPRIQHYDAYRRRVDRIVLPESTVEALAVAHGREKLGAPNGNPFEFYARGYGGTPGGGASQPPPVRPHHVPLLLPPERRGHPPADPAHGVGLRPLPERLRPQGAAAEEEDASVEFSRMAPRIVNAFADRALLEAGSSIAEG